MKHFSNRFGKLVASATFGTIAFGVQAQDLKPLNVLLPNENTTTLYPAIVARALGFFEDEGLDVTLLSSEVTIPYVAFLANNQADLVMLDAPQTFQALNADQPITVIYEGMQFAPEGMFVAEDSPVQSVAELKGTTVGLASDRDQVTLQVALDTAGLTIDDVDTVVVGDTGPVLANAIRNESVSAVAAALNDLTTIEANGIPMREITPPEVSENPANSLVIATSRIEELRPVVTSFLRAWAKGAAAAKIDRDAVAAMAKQSIPEEWEVEEGGQALLEASMKMNLPQTPEYGGLQPDVWKAIQAPYLKFGVIEAEIDPATFLDDSFVAPANDFDEAEVKAAIDEWKAANPDLAQ